MKSRIVVLLWSSVMGSGFFLAPPQVRKPTMTRVSILAPQRSIVACRRRSPFELFSQASKEGESEGNFDQAIRRVEDEIFNLSKEVDTVKLKLDDLEERLVTAKRKGDMDEVAELREGIKYLREKEKQLREKEKQLREEKRQLREKEKEEKQLREEKLLAALKVTRSEDDILRWLQRQERVEGPMEMIKDGVGAELPFQGRQEEFKQLFDLHEMRFGNRTVGDRRVHPIPTYLGQSGIGKTRFMQEHCTALIRLAEERLCTSHDVAFAKTLRKAFVDIRVTFGNGSPLDASEDPGSAIGVRMLHAHFAGRSYFIEFSRALREFLGQGPIMGMTPFSAAKLIRQDCAARGELDSADNLVVVLGVDEVNHVLMEGADAFERRRRLTPMIRSLGGALCGALSGERGSVFICPLLTGTVIGDVKQVIASSSHYAKHLQPSPLTAEEVHNIVLDRGWAPSVMADPNLNRTLADLGGVPLVLARFIWLVEDQIRDCRRAGAQIDARAYESLRRRTLECMLEAVSSLVEFSGKLKGLVVAAIEGQMGWVAGSTFEGITLEQLQANGVLSLGKTGTIQVPIIYLESLVEAWIRETKLSDIDGAVGLAVSRVLAFDGTLRWEAFEQWNRDYAALRLLLARKRELEALPLSELFGGAWVGADLLDSELDLTSDSLGSVRDVRSLTGRRFPPSNASQVVEELAQLEAGAVYLNSKGAPCDIVVAFELLGEAETHTRTRVPILYECRHTSQRPTDAKRIRVTEMEEAIAKVRQALGTELCEKFVLIFVSNRQLVDHDSTIVQPDSVSDVLRASGNLSRAVVVVRQNSVAYFGMSLAVRFMGFAEPWELEMHSSP